MNILPPGERRQHWRGQEKVRRIKGFQGSFENVYKTERKKERKKENK